MTLATLMMLAALSQGPTQPPAEQEARRARPSPAAAAANTFRRRDRFRDRSRDLVCTSDAPTGSRVLRNRTCVTRAEHEARAALARQEAVELTGRAHIPDPADLGGGGPN